MPKPVVRLSDDSSRPKRRYLANLITSVTTHHEKVCSLFNNSLGHNNFRDFHSHKKTFRLCWPPENRQTALAKSLVPLRVDLKSGRSLAISKQPTRPHSAHQAAETPPRRNLLRHSTTTFAQSVKTVAAQWQKNPPPGAQSGHPNHIRPTTPTTAHQTGHQAARRMPCRAFTADIAAQRDSASRPRNALPVPRIRRSRRPPSQTAVAVPRQTPADTSQHVAPNLLCPNGFRLKTMKPVLPQQHSPNLTTGGLSGHQDHAAPQNKTMPQTCCLATHFKHTLRDLFCPNRFHANTARHGTGQPASPTPPIPQNNCGTTHSKHGTTKPVVPQQISGSTTTPVPYPRAATMPRTMPRIAPILLCPNVFRYRTVKPVLPQHISATKQVPHHAGGRHRIPPYPPILLCRKASR
jgi:hypothetical protein